MTDAQVAQQRKVDIRKTHPALYSSIRNLALGFIALAINFWFAHPTFTPLNIPNRYTSAVFGVLGVALLVFLMVYRNLHLVRIALAGSIMVSLAWGLINTQQWINGKASLQLPIWVVLVAAQARPWLVEAPVNPMTEVTK